MAGSLGLSGLLLVLNCVSWLSSDASDTSSKVEPLAKTQGLFLFPMVERGRLRKHIEPAER